MTPAEQLLNSAKAFIEFGRRIDGSWPIAMKNLATDLEAAIARAESYGDGWRPWSEDVPINEEVLVYRPDALVFTAWFHVPEDIDGEGLWFSTNGEDLSGDLPTHWRHLPAPTASGGE
jgi:hypothetical protein